MFALFALICSQIGCGLFLVDGSETQKASTTAPATTSIETETVTNSPTTDSTTSSSTDTSTTTTTTSISSTTSAGGGGATTSTATDSTTTDSGTGGAGGSTTTMETDGGAPQPDAEADAGDTPDAEAPDAGNSDAGCVREITVESLDHVTGKVPAGTKDLKVMSVKLTASACGDIEIKLAGYTLVTPDYDQTDSTPFCAPPCATPSDWNFLNARVMNGNATVMGPLDFAKHSINAPAYALFKNSFTVTSGTTMTVTFTMDIASQLKTDINGKRFKLFLDGTGGSNADIETYINSVDGGTYFTVTQPSPTVTFTYGAYYGSAIAVPHPWCSVGLDGLDVQNTGDTKQKITQLTIKLVSSNSDFADFRFIGIGGGAADWNGKLVDTLPAYPATSITVDLSKDPIVLPPHSSYPLMLSGSFNDVVSSAACPSGHGCARSGHTPMLQITGAVVSDGIVNVPAHTTPLVVLRQSQPIITNHELDHFTLKNGDMDFMEMKIAADTTGPISFKQIHFVMTTTEGLSVTDIRVLRNGDEMDVGTYAIQTSQFGANTNGEILSGGGSTTAILNFPDGGEEIVTDSGNVYTLRGTVDGVGPGSQISGQFQTNDAWGVPPTAITGSLITADPWLEPFAINQNNGKGVAWCMLCWSDQSEIPHSGQLKADGGSSDWIDAQLFKGFEKYSAIGNTNSFNPYSP